MKGPTAITIGNFDGVHIGHQAILKKLVSMAQDEKARSVAILFHPHPSEVLFGNPPEQLTSIDFRGELLKNYGIEEVIILPFTQKLSETSVKDFVQDKLKDELKMKALCIGATTHLGKNQEGTPEVIRELGKKLLFRVETVSEVKWNGEGVSSSRIRKAIEEGEVSAAFKMLGRPHLISATVGKGDARGSKIGFPTANLTKIQNMVPGKGVYSTRLKVRNRTYLSVTNVGVRPTFYKEGGLTVETHVIQGDPIDIRGESVELQWIDRIRKEQKFENIEKLREAIQHDIVTAKKQLS